MTDRRTPRIREEDPSEAHERIDLHVKNDAKRWLYLAWAVIVEFILICVLSIAFMSLLGNVRDNTDSAQNAAAKASQAALAANQAANAVNDTAVKAREAAHRSTIAICFEVAYLENVLKQTRNLIRLDPDPARRKTRREQMRLTRDLLVSLTESVGGDCPKPKKPKKP